MAVAQRFRRIVRSLVPEWLQSDALDGGEGDGGRVVYSLGLVLDCFTERMRQALELRMPRRAPESALPFIADDRGLLRGTNEPRADFADRLVAWRVAHGVRGTGEEVTRQVWHFTKNSFATHVQVVAAVDHMFEIDELDPTATPAVTLSSPGFGMYDNGGWDGADPAVHWAHFWIVLRDAAVTPQLDWGDPDLFGGSWGSGGGFTLGQIGPTQDDIEGLRNLFRRLHWGPGHARPEWVIVEIPAAYGGGYVNPDSTYQYWSRYDAGVARQVATRSANMRYWSLDPKRNNVFSGAEHDTALFAEAADMVGGGTYGGDPDVFPLSSTLPGGIPYAGHPGDFRGITQLPDDGSAV